MDYHHKKQICRVDLLTQTHLDHYQRAVMLLVGLSYILYSRLEICIPISVFKYQKDKGQITNKMVGTNIKHKVLVIIYLQNPAIDNASMLDSVPPVTITSASPN